MILVAEEAKKEALINPESPDKWRTLSMTPLSSDPVILQLQKSLACATLENDLLEAKVSKVNQLQVAPVFFWKEIWFANLPTWPRSKLQSDNFTVSFYGLVVKL